jgi:predicted ATPase/signal transduction histidine kinase
MNLTIKTSLQSLPAIPGYHLVEQPYLGSRTVVYRALQTATQRPVVIKVLRQDYPSFGELVQFRNQYAIAKNLPISGIVHPLGLELLGSGYGLVMEDCGGVSLGKYIQQQSLEVTEVLAIALQVADILHDLIQHRVVHKDIKPANILIHPDSKQVKLIDFSIASLLPKETQEIQSPNILEGTLAYLAPEQTGRMNRGIDYRADFYALGVTLYELLTGQLPFTSEDPLELMHCHIAKVPVSADQVNPEVPAMVAAIVTKLMAKNAENRYQSAMGLKHDLEQCLTQWNTLGAIAAFELGARDLSDRFLIPEKLYGREAEVQTLLEAFDRVADGASELMLVAGFSGIGKTAVVNEVHKPIVRQRGYFIKGKFDQFNRNIPLSAFVQALRDLMGQLLSESDETLAQWQSRILAAVGENGQVLMDVIPELEQIIGKQPIAPELSGSAAQNRFNSLFQKFIEVFTTADHPLVMFLDDLQWADLASLQLIKLLMNDNGYLLMLGAYRDNEVSPVHPFILTVEEIRKANAIVNTITLLPLTFSNTNELIADTLKCSRELAQPLTELIDRKTQGNPFFTTQFLKALHDNEQITFDRDRRYWKCDIAQVNALALTDDVVEFMALQLQKLPPETQQVLKLAACVGNQFDLSTLAIVSEQSPTDTATALWKALQEGLILPTSQVYKFFQGEEQSPSQSSINPKYRFLHDRIQQAAYSLIPDDQKQATHLSIGQRIFSSTAEADLETNIIFEIVGHFNISSDLITHIDQKIELAKLNLIAGRKAKASIAYDASLEYFNLGLDLLPEDIWEIDYSFSLALHEGATGIHYLCKNNERMQQLAEIVISQSKTVLDRIKVQEIKISAQIAQSELAIAITLAIDIVKQLGIDLPMEPSSVDIQTIKAEITTLLPLSNLQSLLELPPMTEANLLAALTILESIHAASFLYNRALFALAILTEVKLSLVYGNSPLSPIAYAGYSCLLMNVFQQPDLSYEFGLLSLEMSDRFGDRAVDAQTVSMVTTFVLPRKQSLQNCVPIRHRGITAAVESSSMESLGWNCANGAVDLFLVGTTLTEAESTLVLYADRLLQFNQIFQLTHVQIVHQTILNLLDQTEYPGLLVGEVLDEVAVINSCQTVDTHSILSLIGIFKVILSCILDQPDRARDAAAWVRPYISSIAGGTLSLWFYGYDSLAQLGAFPSLSSTEQATALEQVAANQLVLQDLADHAPMNFQAKFDLVKAEHCRVLGQKYEAIEYYDRAIAGAKENGCIQEEALANELAAKFYLDWGKERIAQDYMTNAYYGYANWGAKTKVQDLEHRYPQLLAPILQQQQMALSATETVFSTIVIAPSQTSTTQCSSSGITSISNALDLATVLKASQALSCEIQLDKLLATLLRTVLENAGADKGALLMPRENQWFVEAVVTADQPVQVQSVALSSSSEVCHSLINTVKRSQEPMVIVDAAIHPTLMMDTYIMQQQPKSLLCTPILQQGKLVAVLYLENHVTVGAFTSDRVELLNLLCAQAAISLENARLYQQAQNHAQQIEESQLQIVQSEKMASLGNLVAGVAHEINNPIGFLNGSIKNTKDYVQDLLEHLALYQQHHPNPATPIQDHAEKIDLEFLSEDLPKLLNSMNGATDRIKGISTSLRTFSRADTDHTIIANLHDGIDSTILILKYRLKANERRPAIEVIQNYGELPSIDCFPGQLNQVFMNILANAIDMFDEMAQTQSFGALKAHPQRITIHTAVVNNCAQIQISDNGKGMTEEVQARIFDHLFTTKGVGKGTGLGLAIVRQIIIEKHMGTLEVVSALGQGTTFIVTLPIKMPPIDSIVDVSKSSSS